MRDLHQWPIALELKHSVVMLSIIHSFALSFAFNNVATHSLFFVQVPWWLMCCSAASTFHLSVCLLLIFFVDTSISKKKVRNKIKGRCVFLDQCKMTAATKETATMINSMMKCVSWKWEWALKLKWSAADGTQLRKAYRNSNGRNADEQ